MSQARARSSRRSSTPEERDAAYLVVGQIVAPRGLRGELKVRVETENPDRFEDLDHLYVGPERRRYTLRGARQMKGFALLLLDGVADRDAAEQLRGLFLYVDQGNALPLGEGEYYQHQIEGLEVFREDGQRLGEVTGVLETGANDVYVVHGPAGEILLPAIRDVISAIDLEAGTMTVRIPEGLID
ncbi:MAG: 16S rRNA processing protein RimM [Chloroflexi bacterium]|nr:16S rRNA processing protein RimM [Chloroflexota bacterium]